MYVYISIYMHVHVCIYIYKGSSGRGYLLAFQRVLNGSCEPERWDIWWKLRQRKLKNCDS